ncbi:sulfur oxidation c-type cytochrome SoxX [Ectothiorhodospiraceae bacterium BW-2]|nr:sulfur oxidation c-type cytochrome SoxX [Ectothiorhodospiraceae bacterium BW-2]
MVRYLVLNAPATALAVVLGLFSVAPASADSAADGADIVFGKNFVFDRKLGNCVACHAMPGVQDDPGAAMPGNIGPPLVAMKQRFKTKDDLYQQIYDPTQANPNSIMPPFGKHEILTQEQLTKVVDFVYSL